MAPGVLLLDAIEALRPAARARDARVEVGSMEASIAGWGRWTSSRRIGGRLPDGRRPALKADSSNEPILSRVEANRSATSSAGPVLVWRPPPSLVLFL